MLKLHLSKSVPEILLHFKTSELSALIPLRVGDVSCSVLCTKQGQCRHCSPTGLLSQLRATCGAGATQTMWLLSPAPVSQGHVKNLSKSQAQ